MKLYQANWSPFPTRVRLVLYAKGIPFEPVVPPGFHKPGAPREAYYEMNPMGRIPALELDDGRILPESEVICEYLEDAFPTPSLRPSDPWALAQVRLISRLCDIYAVMAMVPLFNLGAVPRKDRNPAKLDAAFAELKKALGYLEHYVGTDGYAVGKALSQADGALIPILILSFDWAPKLFEREMDWGIFPKLAAYWIAVQKDPIAKRVLDETVEAIAERQRMAKAAARN